MAKHSESHHVIVPVKTFVATFSALLVLTILTVVASRFDFGSMNLSIALLIAFCKASLVVWIFMGMKWDRGFNFVAFVGSILFLIIFIGFTFSDIAFRDYRDKVEGEYFGLAHPVKPISGAHHE
ncbi:MAG: hypothetical protein EXS67_02680 [Candidatus Margulisbacteria bacterium]|nr:hypothetical protein [Candidatus Margulisiibacteriota bacterium]